jgi:hypothetical protein
VIEAARPHPQPTQPPGQPQQQDKRVSTKAGLTVFLIRFGYLLCDYRVRANIASARPIP